MEATPVRPSYNLSVRWTLLRPSLYPSAADHHRLLRLGEHVGRHASHEEALDAAPLAGGHHDEVGFVLLRRRENAFDGFAIRYQHGLAGDTRLPGGGRGLVEHRLAALLREAAVLLGGQRAGGGG